MALSYRGFLSYSHVDTPVARRLHGRLEGFRIDGDLVGRITPMGPIPRLLRPVFRDREEYRRARPSPRKQSLRSKGQQQASMVRLRSRLCDDGHQTQVITSRWDLRDIEALEGATCRTSAPSVQAAAKVLSKARQHPLNALT